LLLSRSSVNSPVVPLPTPLASTAAHSALVRVADALSEVVAGKRQQIELALTCLVAGGHLLLEDIPGVGKTTLADALARALGLSFARIQFTSDLMPADVTGVQVFSAASTNFQFRPGPLFRSLVLADELNRAPPRTQSALLEAMGHGHVTVDGVTHLLPRPFLVVATQNPLDLAGTYPLPDAQLDRFLLRLTLGHPPPAVEAALLASRGLRHPLESVHPVLDTEHVLKLQARAAEVHVDTEVARYAVELVSCTRQHPQLERGASTRAALSLMAAAKAHALWEARDFVTPGDISALVVPCLAHRVALRSGAQGASAREEAAELLSEIVHRTPAPR
jgi:MoxR-like ATPase